jgi:hypothetical protein
VSRRISIRYARVHELIVSETNKDKTSLLYNDYTFCVDAVLKNQEISWWCTKNSWKCRLRTDSDCRVIIKGKNEQYHLSDERKFERQQLRIKAKRKATDISARHIIPTVLITMSFYCVFLVLYEILNHRDFYYSKRFNWNLILLCIFSAVCNFK